MAWKVRIGWTVANAKLSKNPSKKYILRRFSATAAAPQENTRVKLAFVVAPELRSAGEVAENMAVSAAGRAPQEGSLGERMFRPEDDLGGCVDRQK